MDNLNNITLEVNGNSTQLNTNENLEINKLNSSFMKNKTISLVSNENISNTFSARELNFTNTDENQPLADKRLC